MLANRAVGGAECHSLLASCAVAPALRIQKIAAGGNPRFYSLPLDPFIAPRRMRTTSPPSPSLNKPQ